MLIIVKVKSQINIQMIENAFDIRNAYRKCKLTIKLSKFCIRKTPNNKFNKNSLDVKERNVIYFIM